jgi:hypothetical protein
MTDRHRRLGLLLLAISLGCADETRAPLRFSPDVLPDGLVGQAYLGVLAIAGNETPVTEVAVSAGALPPGLAVALQLPMSVNQVEVTGVPTQAGAWTFTLRVACAGTNRPGQAGEKTLTLTVRATGP